MAMTPRKVVRRRRRREMPSTPTKYCTPIAGIHEPRSTNWNPALSVSYRKNSGAERTKSMSAIQVAPSMKTLLFSRWIGRSARAPARGRKVTIVRMWDRYHDAICVLLRSAAHREQVDAHQDEDPEDHRGGVGLDDAGLQRAEDPRGSAH